MPKLITIVDTFKSGFITVDTNDVYLGAQTNFKQLNIVKNSIQQLNVLMDNQKVEYIEIRCINMQTYFNISHDLKQDRYHPIESVNGETVSTIDELRDKILALL